MADVSSLSKMLQEAAFYEAGGRDPGKSSFDDFQRGFGTVKGVYDFSQDIIKNVLAKKKAEIENKKASIEIEPTGPSAELAQQQQATMVSPNIYPQPQAYGPTMPGQSGVQASVQKEPAPTAPMVEERARLISAGINPDNPLYKEEKLAGMFKNRTQEIPLSIKLLPTEAKNRALAAGYTENDFIDRKTFNAIRGVDPYAPVATNTPQGALKEGTIAGNTRIFDPSAASTRGMRFESDLRKEFINRPEVKDFIIVNTQIKSMDSLLNSALMGDKKNQLALDQALITMFNKLTDPQSVVRESEYARTPDNLPMVNKISGAIDKLKSGGAGMTDDDRKALVLGAKIIGIERGKTYQESRDQYSNLAGLYQLNPEMVVGTLPAFKEDQYNSNASTGTATWDQSKESRYQELLKKKQEGTLK